MSNFKIKLAELPSAVLVNCTKEVNTHVHHWAKGWVPEQRRCIHKAKFLVNGAYRCHQHAAEEALSWCLSQNLT